MPINEFHHFIFFPSLYEYLSFHIFFWLLALYWIIIKIYYSGCLFALFFSLYISIFIVFVITLNVSIATLSSHHQRKNWLFPIHENFIMKRLSLAAIDRYDKIHLKYYTYYCKCINVAILLLRVWAQSTRIIIPAAKTKWHDIKWWQ